MHNTAYQQSALFSDVLPERYGSYSRLPAERNTDLESIENNVELDCVLPADSVVHFTGVRTEKQCEGRDENEEHAQKRVQVGRRDRRETLALDYGFDEPDKGERRSNRKDGEIVQKAVET